MNTPSTGRREVLALLGSGAASGLAGCSGLLSGDGSNGEGTNGQAPTAPMAEDRARRLAERFAPTLSFDAAETWYPTDPRPYATEREGRTVVDGFDAVDGYARRYEEGGGAPPDPTVFYNARTYRESALSVVQFWFYSAFDQFTTNFHWHDWEVLHVFVDDETGEPQLYVASAHARKVPNNEFLDPPAGPWVLSELGSHSSGLSLNARPASFERFPLADAAADVTNDAIESVEALADLPVAYGLPRDEGFGIPYLIPELDGRPVYEHPGLPHLRREHLAPQALTVDSFADLADPPADLPTRSTGVTLGFREGDHEYGLVSADAVEDVAAFTGPQLSYRFAVPQFAENAVAEHISTADAPWTQPRYVDPLADVTDARHRATLAERYEGVSTGGPVSRLVGFVRDVVPDDSAPDGEGVTTTEPTVESVALVESEPVAAPTFRGVVAVQDLPPGEHRLTVNTAGKAPYAESVRVDGTARPSTPTSTAGVEGRVGLVANGDATKLRLDGAAVDVDLREFSVADDFAGTLYRTRPDDRDAVYVHAGGAYTAEVVDADGAIGAFRFNHGLAAGEPATVERPRTGKASLAAYVAAISAGTRTTVEQAAGPVGAAVRGLLTALEAVREAAARAVERAEAGDAAGADARLRAVRRRLDRVTDALATARSALPGAVVAATDRRLEQARTRTEQALAAEKL